jgi:tRNA pseudouridine38-40 synthase
MDEGSIDAGAPLRRLKLVLSYDGARYRGWQIQPNGPSIQAELADAIQKVTGSRSIPVGSGRTDAGVHALGQAAHFDTHSRLPADRIRLALNHHLPRDIVVREAIDVPREFHARKSAAWKLYRYVFHDGPTPDLFFARYCWKVKTRLDVDRMRRAAQCILGTHDFRCFETKWPNRRSSVRTVRRCDVSRLGDFVWIDVESNGFLYNMVRAIAGTLRDVGRGRTLPHAVAAAIESGGRSSAGPTAPAHGLFLVRVEYPPDSRPPDSPATPNAPA